MNSFTKDINGNDLHPDDTDTVRRNMMQDVSYRSYCGSVFPGHPNYHTCSSPRMAWRVSLNQMQCPDCGWVTEFPADFIARYKAAHKLP